MHADKHATRLPATATAEKADRLGQVVLHPSTAERFSRCAPGLSLVARRTLRTNLRFIGRRVVPHLYPQDLPLPHDRAQAPYSRRRSAGTWRWPPRSPAGSGGCAPRR